MPASSPFLCFSLCFLVFCNGAFAQLLGYGGQSAWQSSRSFAGPRGCRFDRLEALNPTQRLRFEAGTVEYYDVYNEMLQCAGVSARRTIIEPRGLFLPQYNNAPSLVYIIQGRGIKGMTFPGCPETFQSFQQETEQVLTGTESQSQQRIRDEHQKVHRFRQGDIIALPAGVTYWCYNDGDVPLVAVQVFDTSNTANQLEPRQRSFFLAGRHMSGQQTYEMGPESYETGQEAYLPGQPGYEAGRQAYQAGMRPIGMAPLRGNNIFNGFDTQMLAEALGVNVQLARQLQAQNDPRGEIVFVPEGLRMLRPMRTQEMQQQEYEESMQGQQQYYGESWQAPYNVTANGLDENFCTMKIRSNIDKPSRADYFNPRVGRIARVDSQKLPILNLVQMSAVRVVLRRNAMVTPYWSMNCHCGMYVTEGQGRVQVVNHQGRTVFDGTVRQGQFLLIPQNFAVLKRADRLQGFNWVTFNTNQHAMINQMAGKLSTLKGMPLQVLMHSYRISIEQARRLKFSRRNEYKLFNPRSPRTSLTDQ